MRKLMVAIAALLFLSTATLILAQRTTGEALFQQGLDQERGKRDIPAAIKIYERILKEFLSNRALIARTLVQLGDSYERLGETKAQEYYQQVIAKYPEQTDMVARARAHVRVGIEEPAVTRNEFLIPSGQNLAHAYRNGVDISPNGNKIAFVANPQLSVERPVPNSRIYLKSIDRFGEAVPIPGTVGGLNPFFSPDGQWLGFFRKRNNNNVQAFDLLKISLVPPAESPVLLFSQPLTDENNDYGASWGSNGRIVFGSFQDGLKWVPTETGGQPQPLTQLDSNAEEAAHRFPHFLPDGSAVLFTVLRYTSTNPNLARAQIWVYSFQTGKRHFLMENGTDARFAPNDSLIFAREGKLYAVRFDPKALTVSGTVVEAVDGDAVTHSKLTGAAQYSVSFNGTLVYGPGSVEPPINTSVAWVDVKGGVTPIELPERPYSSARVSPDGKSILISETGALWLYDVATGNLEKQFTSQGDALSPATWSPSGERFFFSSSGNGPTATYVKAVDSPNVTRLMPHYSFPTWAPDGRLAVLGKSANSDRVGIYLVSPDDPNDIEPLVRNSASDLRSPVFSADGSWLAYIANDTNRPKGAQQDQLYAQRYPAGEPVLVATANFQNWEFVWSRDSPELFGIRAAQGTLLRYTASSAFSLSTETVQIADARERFLYLADAADGGRFLMILTPTLRERTERSSKIFPTTLRMVTNWSADLKRTWGKPTSTTTVTQVATPAGASASSDYQVALLDRKGTLLKMSAPIQTTEVALSPDGTRVAFTSQFDIWVLDLSSGTRTRFCCGGAQPVWSPDGAQLAYYDNKEGFTVRSADGNGRPEVVYAARSGIGLGNPRLYQLYQWSQDGQFLVLSTPSGFALAPLTGDRKMIPILNTVSAPGTGGGAAPGQGPQPRVSPDGRFVAYRLVNLRGVAVRAFDPTGAEPTSTQRPVIPSPQPVHGIRWRKDGEELYYESNGVLMAVPIGTTPELKAGTPTPLFRVPSNFVGNDPRSADISADGQRFVFLVRAQSQAGGITGR